MFTLKFKKIKAHECQKLIEYDHDTKLLTYRYLISVLEVKMSYPDN